MLSGGVVKSVEGFGTTFRNMNMGELRIHGHSRIVPAWSGALNMAADEWLLERAVHDHVATLRFYTWGTPTVSLGHFQAGRVQGETRPDAERGFEGVPQCFLELPWVRRLSGGGAILHHHELTYSCALPSGHPLAREPRDLYGVVHAALVDFLKGVGVDAGLRGRGDSERDGNFLCFSRGDPQDIVVGPHKVVGSAQRRRKGAVLQHGSLLLERSRFAPEFPGIRDLGAPDLSLEGTLQVLSDRLEGLLAGAEGDLVPEQFHEEDLRQIEALAAGYVVHLEREPQD